MENWNIDMTEELPNASFNQNSSKKTKKRSRHEFNQMNGLKMDVDTQYL